ncbi:MAG: hypothetical protein ACREIU_10545, partial [Planctomycetota bacterium]
QRVRIERAQLTLAGQGELLRDLAWISAARLEPLRSDYQWGQFGCNGWSYVRISEASRPPWEDAWAGGTSSGDEASYARSRACVARVQEAVSDVRFEAFKPSAEDLKRILDSLSRRAYAGRPWRAFGNTEPLAEVYRRLAIAVGGDPETCLPQPREVVEFRVGGPPRSFQAQDRLKIWTTSGVEVPTFPWICPTPTPSPECWTIRLEPGEYTAVVDVPDYEPRRYPLTVRRGGGATVDLELVPRETRR